MKIYTNCKLDYVTGGGGYVTKFGCTSDQGDLIISPLALFEIIDIGMLNGKNIVGNLISHTPTGIIKIYHQDGTTNKEIEAQIAKDQATKKTPLLSKDGLIVGGIYLSRNKHDYLCVYLGEKNGQFYGFSSYQYLDTFIKYPDNTINSLNSHMTQCLAYIKQDRKYFIKKWKTPPFISHHGQADLAVVKQIYDLI